MARQLWVSVISIFVAQNFFSTVEGNCQFDSTLQGRWKGTDGRELTFTEDRMTGFNLTVPNLSSSDFVCVSSSTQNSITKYLLRAVESVRIFNVRPVLYMCLEEENGFFKHYAIDTKKDPLLQDYLYGTALTGVPNEQFVCDAPDEQKYNLQPISEVVPKSKMPLRETAKEQRINRLLDLLRHEMERRNF